ncbi:MAG TPA: hypothetical protein VK607_07955, partial [Kofleriaceae bacterium]|nr:hypothetical protein [Kofleriaceae bacterium]
MVELVRELASHFGDTPAGWVSDRASFDDRVLDALFEMSRRNSRILSNFVLLNVDIMPTIWTCSVGGASPGSRRGSFGFSQSVFGSAGDQALGQVLAEGAELGDLGLRIVGEVSDRYVDGERDRRRVEDRAGDAELTERAGRSGRRGRSRRAPARGCRDRSWRRHGGTRRSAQHAAISEQHGC